MKRNVMTVTLFAAFLLGGCGDSPESMQEALAETAPTLAYVDDTAANCAGEVILDNISFEELTAAGYSSDEFGADGSKIQEVIDQYDSPELRTALTGCIDVNDAFRGELIEQAGGAEDSVTCDYEFSTDDDLVNQYLDSRFADELPLEVEDTSDNRDLLRPCLAEAAFSQQFGLDLPSDLAAAIQAALPPSIEALPCAGESVVTEVGAETLNDIGVTVGTPDIDIRNLGLSISERNELLGSLADCSEIDIARRSQLQSEQPVFGECAIDADLRVWKSHAIANELGQQTNLAELKLIEELRGCAQDRAEEITGTQLGMFDLTTMRTSAYIMVPADERLAEMTATEAMLECAVGVLIGELGIDEYDALFDAWLMADNDTDFWLAHEAFLAEFYPARLACEGASVFVHIELYRLDFSQETIDCVDSFVGGADSFAALLINLYTNDEITQREIDAYFDSSALWEEGLEQCHTPAEDSKMAAIYDQWDAGTTTEDQSF